MLEGKQQRCLSKRKKVQTFETKTTTNVKRVTALLPNSAFDVINKLLYSLVVELMLGFQMQGWKVNERYLTVQQTT